jgi:DNA-binding NarL/FixJ family response regulator
VGTHIIILEDNEARREAIRRCLAERFHQFAATFFEHPAVMIDYLRSHLADAVLISLDHDLELLPGPEGKLIDPGTGREVADFLARHTPVCPVVIHTSNSAAATGMEMVLAEAHWKTYRVVPCDDLTWIATQWVRTVRRAIFGPNRRERHTAP